MKVRTKQQEREWKLRNEIMERKKEWKKKVYHRKEIEKGNMIERTILGRRYLVWNERKEDAGVFI